MQSRVSSYDSLSGGVFGGATGTGDGAEYKKLLEEFADAVEERAEQLPHMVWKEMVPTHYDQQHGLYPGGEPPFTCAPLHVELQANGTIQASLRKLSYTYSLRHWQSRSSHHQ